MVKNLSEKPGIHQVFLSRMRDVQIQKNQHAFRNNMQRLGQILAYEISTSLPERSESVTTPLGTSIVRIPEKDPVLCCILRAGIPFFNGFLDYFDQSHSGFIGAFRGSSKPDFSFDIEMDYLALPPFENCPLILIDPMLASGKSMVKAAKALLSRHKPSQLLFACLIASPEGIELLQSEWPDAGIWTIAIDELLNDHAYIVPGLGDAGDLSFGPKVV